MKKSVILLILLISFVYAQNEDILLGTHNKIFSKSIGEEREYFVSLPKSYENSVKKYPVLYMMDGENNFNVGIIGGIRYLEMMEEIPELIIVGVKNTDRTRDVFPYKLRFRSGLTGGGGADNYLAFFRNELQPMINSKYRTSDYKIFYGTSNSAFTAVYELFKNPDSYDAYISSSATLIRPYMEKADSIITNWKGKDKYLNLIVGENDFVGLPKTNAEFKEKIERNRIKGLTLKYTILEGESHVPPTSLLVGLRDLFNNFKFNENLTKDNFESYIKHFVKQSKKHKTNFVPSEGKLNRLAYSLLRDQDDKNKALDVFKYMVEKFPNSSNAFDSLAEAYMVLGKNKLAIKNYEKSLELDPKNENAVNKIKEIKAKM